MHSKRRHEGWLMIDNRASPGIDDKLIGADKFAPVVGEGQVYESATVTCAHCSKVVVLNPNRTRPRHYCQKCDHYVCDELACATECVPFDKIINDILDGKVYRIPESAIRRFLS